MPEYHPKESARKPRVKMLKQQSHPVCGGLFKKEREHNRADVNIGQQNNAKICVMLT